MFSHVRSTLSCLLLLGVTGLPAYAAVPSTPAAVPSITQPIEAAQLTPILGELTGYLSVSQDLGIVDDTLALPHLQLLLKRSPARQAALDALVSAQLKHGSPAFHKWVDPAELFAAFGPAPSDIAKIQAWLTLNGFSVNSVTADGMVIDFSGTARQAENLFHTEIHNLRITAKATSQTSANPPSPPH